MTNPDQQRRAALAAVRSRLFFMLLLGVLAWGVIIAVLYRSVVIGTVVIGLYAIMGLVLDYRTYYDFRLRSAKTIILWPFRGLRLYLTPGYDLVKRGLPLVDGFEVHYPDRAAPRRR